MSILLTFAEVLMIMMSVVYGLLLFERSDILSKISRKHRAKKLAKKEEDIRKNVPVIQQVDPIRAYKLAYVLDSGCLAGIGFYDKYKPQDKAICRYNNKHPKVPSLGCTCGFWGLHTPKEALCVNASTPHIALMEIEFFGEVLHLELGYRAEQQRILSLKFYHSCIGCGNKSDRFISIRLHQEPSNDWHLDNSTNVLPPYVKEWSGRVARSIGGDSPLMQFCEECIKKFLIMRSWILDIKIWTLADISNMFQIEVNWIPEEQELPSLRMEQYRSKITEFTPHLTIFSHDFEELVTIIKKGQ